MNVSVTRFLFEETSLWKIGFSIRTSVFVEEQGVEAVLERENEEEAHYYLLQAEGAYIATARWRETTTGIKLERFALLPEYRNKGLGSVLLDAVLQDIIPLKKEMYLHAQLKAVSYYARKGFVTEGSIFEEAGIKHYRMVRVDP